MGLLTMGCCRRNLWRRNPLGVTEYEKPPPAQVHVLEMLLEQKNDCKHLPSL